MIISKHATAGTISFLIAVTTVAALGDQEAVAQTAIPPSTQDFALSAGQSDEYEILASRDALAQSQNPSVRAFAREMIDDHARMSETLRQAVTASGLPQSPPAMSGDQAAMLSALQSLRGADFDRAYARQQVLAHDQARAVEDGYAKSGADKNLRKIAQSGIPLIEHHLEMAEKMSAVLGGS
jgi:putative membrane protein